MGLELTYDLIARRIDHSLLGPTLTDRELEEGCKLAMKYHVASVCIKPYAVPWPRVCWPVRMSRSARRSDFPMAATPPRSRSSRHSRRWTMERPSSTW